MKTIQMTIDDLLKLVDKMSRASRTTRSAFIRQASKAEMNVREKTLLEALHTAGAPANP